MFPQGQTEFERLFNYFAFMTFTPLKDSAQRSNNYLTNRREFKMQHALKIINRVEIIQNLMSFKQNEIKTSGTKFIRRSYSLYNTFYSPTKCCCLACFLKWWAQWVLKKWFSSLSSVPPLLLTC